MLREKQSNPVAVLRLVRSIVNIKHKLELGTVNPITNVVVRAGIEPLASEQQHCVGETEQ